ncbi:MAG: phosphoglycolate phosphatase [Firmicutes bacterium HGW-Firmicutes-4]|jgi:phosphoglycolate phosphatase|nr:MAG: phosphoglycolate phosphatase [Firmicutes bacterium HGW-Firmicutes-3]PKM60896.1 MAG: phosphoglycolate phosphatase [Firmicutes bacterium HGW-Firmicutes-4]
MHKYKGIIFDLDGTLVNSLEDLIDSVNGIMRYHQFPVHSYEEGKKFIGRGLRNLTRDALPEKYRDDEGFVDKLTEMVRSEYANNYQKKTRPYPGITKLLDYLKNHNIPWSVCTNKPDNEAKALVKALFSDYDCVDVQGFTRDELRKPNPEITLELVAKMGLKPQECLYVGDSVVDYETALRAGMLPVLCTWGFESFEVLTKLDDAIWLHNPMRIVEALRYGKEMYSLFNETPDPNPNAPKKKH